MASDEFADNEPSELERAVSTWIIVVQVTTEAELDRVEQELRRASCDIEVRDFSARSAVLRVAKAQRAIVRECMEPFGDTWRVLSEGEWREQRSNTHPAWALHAAQLVDKVIADYFEAIGNPIGDPSRNDSPGTPWGSEQREALQDALLDAFPDFPALEMMVDLKLGRSLALYIQKGSRLDQACWSLINSAKAEGWADELVCGANRGNPGNPLLSRLVTGEFGTCQRCAQPRDSERCRGRNARSPQ